MAALVMAVAAGMVVGNGPDEISSEAREELCGGYWEGNLYHWLQNHAIHSVTLAPGSLWTQEPGGIRERYTCEWIDDGNGRCRAHNWKESVHRHLPKAVPKVDYPHQF